MADGQYRFPEGAGHSLLNRGVSNGAFRTHERRQFSPAHNSNYNYPEDNDSIYGPSVARQSPPNQYAMFSQNNQAGGHNAFVNGGHGHQNQRFGIQMNPSKPFQNGPQHPPGHPQRPQQDVLNQSQSNYVNHQHNSSTGFTAGTPHFTPGQLRNGTPGNLPNGMNRPHGEHWNLQVHAAQQSREANEKHFWARNHNTHKTLTAIDSDTVKKEGDQEERNRAIASVETSGESWSTLDMCGLGLRLLLPHAIRYNFLKKLYLNNNKLRFVPPEMGQLRLLTHLDLSQNQLEMIPPELGMLVNLKELRLFDNHLELLPDELGSLHQLDLLGIEGNPLNEDLKSMVFEEGTKAYISHIREHGSIPDPPNDRQVYTISEKTSGMSETFSVMSYNALCDKYATQNQYGYASSRALDWEVRKQIILGEVVGRNADIICLQEIDVMSFNDFFKVELSFRGYRGLFYPKTRAKTMADRETKSVDGCATFYKHSKYILLDKQQVEFTTLAISKPDMKGDKDVYNRVMPRDDIALVAFLEERDSGARFIVANAHIFWNPQYKDVKVVQAAILMEQVQRFAEQWVRHPPCEQKQPYRHSEADTDVPPEVEEPPKNYPPSQSYEKGTDIPLIVCGDFNSLPDSGVHQLISSGSLRGDHSDIAEQQYGNYTRQGINHPFNLKSAYGTIGELSFTNYTPGFTGVIDYIWYSANALQVMELLGDVDEEYLRRVPGFPNAHFPSDHLALLASFAVRRRKDKVKGMEGERSGYDQPATESG
ncbi:MAG: Glucose-repressible alcohol dehydrogenase transcriptional effector [Alyxoria varia]|nr:MAG: Glucose-repressible alcohol dehydrogenase transcriptional effector [Alyxoria varia]